MTISSSHRAASIRSSAVRSLSLNKIDYGRNSKFRQTLAVKRFQSLERSIHTPHRPKEPHFVICFPSDHVMQHKKPRVLGMANNVSREI